MEEEERPRKLLKLSHGEPQEDVGSAATNAVTEKRGPEDGPSAHLLRSSTADQDHTNANNEVEENGNTKAISSMSKKQMKKLRRHEQWEATRDQRRARRKEKAAEKRQQRRAELEEAKRQGIVTELPKMRGKSKPKPQNSILLPVTFIIDCGFDELMMEKERISLASQITRSYSDNSKAHFCGHLVVSSFEKLLKERFDTVLRKSHENWKSVRFMQEDYISAARMAKEWMNSPRGGQMAGVFEEKTGMGSDDGETVYLTAESPNTLTELKPYSTYIVGGLVDRNRHKGICYKRAMDVGIKTAKLPIGDYIRMDSRQVLTTNHVVEIMLRWLELGDWGRAFVEVLPQRKGVLLKEDDKGGQIEDQEGDGREEEEEEGENG